MITEYFVCYGADSNLAKNVNEAIKKGWQPVGGVAVSIKWLGGDIRDVPGSILLYQAVVRMGTDERQPTKYT